MREITITNSKQALRESKALKSVWSNETVLTQRILIYIASLLEDLNRKKRRRPTRYQIHIGKMLKRGGTMQQAVREWQKRGTAK